VTADRKRVRNRVLALAGLWLLVAGLLAATSFVVLAVVGTVVLLLVALVIGTILALRRLPVGEGLATAADSTGQAAGTLAASIHRLEIPRRIGVGFRAAGAWTAKAGRGIARDFRALRLRQRTRSVGARAKDAAAAAPGRTRVLVDRSGQRYASAVYRSSAATAKAFGVAGRLAAPFSSRLTGQRRALQLNERGVQLRRSGDAEQAAEQHRVALEIARDLGDPFAEALTLNSLGLALAQRGLDTAAAGHFEEALTVLQELGEEEHAAQVIANRGVVRSRQGRSEEAVSLLSSALDKLPPESPAYRQVEEQLQRAS
jgi:tetratricopeptide (TPR) repeat protein